jgi:hypothetical protein
MEDDTRLLGLLSVSDGQDSSSVASYRSSKDCSPCCHSSSEQDEDVECDETGVDNRFAVSGEKAMAILIECKLSRTPISFFRTWPSGEGSFASIIVLSSGLRASRKGELNIAAWRL